MEFAGPASDLEWSRNDNAAAAAAAERAAAVCCDDSSFSPQQQQQQQRQFDPRRGRRIMLSSAMHFPLGSISSAETMAAAAVEQQQQQHRNNSAEYLRTIAAELNDVGAELHSALLVVSHGGGEPSERDDYRDDGETDAEAKVRRLLPPDLFDAAMGLYKEAASTMMEAVDASSTEALMPPPPLSAEELAEFDARSKDRVEKIVEAKEMLLERRERDNRLEQQQRGGLGGGSSSGKKRAAGSKGGVPPPLPLKDVMLFGPPNSPCDVGPVRLTTPVTSSDVVHCDADRDRVGSATLCNIGLLQLRRAEVEAECGNVSPESESALLDSALRFFRMSLAASEEDGSNGGSAMNGACAAAARLGGVDRVTSLNNLGYGLYRKGMLLESVEFFKDAIEEMDAVEAAAVEAAMRARRALRPEKSILKRSSQPPPAAMHHHHAAEQQPEIESTECSESSVSEAGFGSERFNARRSFEMGRHDGDALALGEDMLSCLEDDLLQEEALAAQQAHAASAAASSYAAATTAQVARAHAAHSVHQHQAHQVPPSGGADAAIPAIFLPPPSWSQHARIVLLLNASRSLHAANRIESAFDVSTEALELCLQAEEAAQREHSPSADGEMRSREECHRDRISSVSAALLYNLGVLYELQEFSSRALQCYRQFVDRTDPDAGSSKNKSSSHRDSPGGPERVAALTRILLLECADLPEDAPSSLRDVVKVLIHLRDARAELGHDHPSLSAALRCVGSALSDREEHKYALPFLLESLRIKRAADSDSSASSSQRRGEADGGGGGGSTGANSDTVVALNALGECYHGMGRLDDARRTYEEVRTIRRERLDAVVRDARAAARRAALYQDSSTPPPPTPAAAGVSSIRFIFAVTLYNGGRVLFEQGKREEAARYFGDALELADAIVAAAAPTGPATIAECATPSEMERVINEDPEGARRHLLECASLLHNVGQYETELGRTSDALKCLEGALDIRKKANDRSPDGTVVVDESEVAATLYQLGGLRRRVGDEGGAWECYAESLEIEKRATAGGRETNSTRVASILFRMAQLRYERSELEQSLGLFRTALAVVSHEDFASPSSQAGQAQQSNSADDDQDGVTSRSTVLGWIGTVLGEMGLVGEARQSFESSRRARDEEEAERVANGQGTGGANAPSSSSGFAPGLSVETFAEMLEGRPAAAA